jgi:MFS family permease
VTALALRFGRRTFRSLRRHRNYRVFFTGQVVSLAGSWMQNIALAWLVIELSGSALAVGALAFCRFMPFLAFGLVAGVVVDRFDTRRLLAVTQGTAMVVSVLLAVVTIADVATLPVVYALAALGGLVLVVDAPGRQTLTFQMVGPAELQNAVALNSGLFNASRVVGPAIAGLLIAAVGTGLCFVVNAVSFLAVLISLYLLRPEELKPVDRQPTRVLAGIREGVQWAWHAPLVRTVLAVVTVVSTVGFNFHVLVPLLASQTLDAGAETFGILSSAFGLGALAGALATASLREASPRAFLGGAVGFSFVMLALALADSVLVALALLFLLGVSFSLFTASASALLQLAAPDRLRGRIVSLFLFAFAGLAPVGGLVAGFLAEQGGTPLAFGVAGVAGLAATVWALRQLRTAAPVIARAESG